MSAFNPEYKTKLIHLLNESPFINHIGMQFVEIGKGICKVRMPYSPYRLQPFDVVHGGNVASLIDSATLWSCFVDLGSDDDGLTSVDLKLNYLSSVKDEGLVCDAKLIKAGKTISLAEARVFTESGRLIAFGTSTIMRMNNKGLHFGLPVFINEGNNQNG